MKTRSDVEKLEKTIGQLAATHREVSLLSKKSPNDGVNSFKLKLINGVIEAANQILGQAYKPIQGFELFDEDNLPSTSDVVFVVAQYLEEIERYRQDNVVLHEYKRVYVLDGKPSRISEDPKSRVMQ